jgi:hypothetical protein
MRPFYVRRLTALGSLAVGLTLAPFAQATSGAHAPAISTFDTRASSVVLAGRLGFGDTTWRAFSYNANFTSTSGNFSAQFGIHYLQIRETDSDTLLHGAAASGAGVFNIPLTDRFDNGVPFAAFNLYGGAVPTAAVSGPSNFISLPITIGIGTTLSPTPWLSFTPWFEVAPSGTLDTRLRQPDLSQLAGVDTSTVDVTQLTPEQVQQLQGQQQLFTEDDVNQVIDDSVDLRFSIHVPLRAGLMITARASERFSFNLDTGIVGFGPAFQDAVVGYVGLGMVLHWDDIVPAVLPASRRLEEESCADIEARFRMCPAGKKLFSQNPPAAKEPVVPLEASPLEAPGKEAVPLLPEPAAVPAGVVPTPAPASSTPPPVTPTGPTGAPPAASGATTPAAATEALPARTSPYDSKPPSASFPK